MGSVMAMIGREREEEKTKLRAEVELGENAWPGRVLGV